MGVKDIAKKFEKRNNSPRKVQVNTSRRARALELYGRKRSLKLSPIKGKTKIPLGGAPVFLGLGSRDVEKIKQRRSTEAENASGSGALRKSPRKKKLKSPKPSTTHSPKPITRNSPKPTNSSKPTRQSPRPTTRQSPKLTTRQSPKPTTRQSPKPTTRQSPKPTTRQSQKPIAQNSPKLSPRRSPRKTAKKTPATEQSLIQKILNIFK